MALPSPEPSSTVWTLLRALFNGLITVALIIVLIITATVVIDITAIVINIVVSTVIDIVITVSGNAVRREQPVHSTT